MNKQEATKLLAIIKLSYPTAYRDMDEVSKKATVNMWAGSFPEVPYPIMEQAFNHFRMVSKFPPTVAEMVEELRHLHYQALEQANWQQLLGNDEMLKQCMLVMSITEKYKDTRNLGGLDMSRLQGRIGGDYDAGASGNWLDRGDRVSLMDAGDGSPE